MNDDKEATFMHLRTCLAHDEKGLRLCRELFETLQAEEQEDYLRRLYTLELEQQVAELKRKLGEHVPSGQQPPGKTLDAYDWDGCTDLLPDTRTAFAFLHIILPGTVPARGALNDLKTQIIALSTRCAQLMRQVSQLQQQTRPETPVAPHGPPAPQPPEE